MRCTLIALMVLTTRENSSAASPKCSFSSYSHHLAIIMLSLSVPGMDCQISSVMNGMNGCSSLRIPCMM